VLAVWYDALERVLQLVCLRFRSTAFTELEIVDLRHELAVFRRHVQRSAFQSVHPMFLAAASRILPRASRRPLSSRRLRSCGRTGVWWRTDGRTRAASVELLSANNRSRPIFRGSSGASVTARLDARHGRVGSVWSYSDLFGVCLKAP
jgi:hypothetical protein